MWRLVTAFLPVPQAAVDLLDQLPNSYRFDRSQTKLPGARRGNTDHSDEIMKELIGRDVKEECWPEENDRLSVEDELRDRWNAMIDAEPPVAPRSQDPGTVAGGSPEEPPF